MKKNMNKLINSFLKELRSFERFLPSKERHRYKILAEKIDDSNQELNKMLKASNKLLLENKEQYQSLIDNIDLGITLIDENYQVLMVSDSNLRMHSLQGADVLKKHCYRQFAKRDSVCSTCPGTIAMTTGKVAVVEDEGTRDDGSKITVRIKAFPIFDRDGKARKFIEVVEDITDRKKAEQEIAQLAYFDSLTELPNRILMKDRLNQLLFHARREGAKLGVLFIDLDDFKRINDTKGHNTGDELLRAVARRLAKVVRANDTVARLGGDEFIIIVSDIRQDQDVALVAKAVMDSLSEPFLIEGIELFTTASLGISLFPVDGDSVNQLLTNADTAMYAAKEGGKDRYQFYSPEMNKKAVERLEIEGYLRKAIEKNELSVVYQPQVDVRTRQVIGVEALLRWKHPTRGMFPPDKFISVAEDTGLIVQLGEWVLNTACRQLRQWHAQGHTDLRLAVNISGKQIKDKNYLSSFQRIITELNLEPNTLELEITESLLMANAGHTVEILHGLQQMGISLAIDDFGTGYCSLSYLKNFPINRIKIDKSFISEVPANQNDASIIQAIIALSSSLGLHVLAEGVETVEQMSFLERNGCHAMQGYLFSRPRPAGEIDELLSAQREGNQSMIPRIDLRVACPSIKVRRPSEENFPVLPDQQRPLAV